MSDARPSHQNLAEAGKSSRPLTQEVPFKTIIATIVLVVVTYLSWLFIKRVGYILELITVAAFFAIALNPAVDWLSRLTHMRRGLAATLVFVTGASILVALVYVFVHPLVNQSVQFFDNLPQMVQDAQQGKGTVGKLVQRYHIEKWVHDNQDKLKAAATSSTGSVVDIASTVASTIASVLTVLVLSFLMLLEGPSMLHAPLIFFDKKQQERIRKVSADGAKAISGYVTGNLLISAIAGIITFLNLTILDVPFSFVLAVWVAFADLIPLIGATMGAVPTILIAFLHSTKAGVITFVVYVIYQQFENHALQPAIMARTVKMNPLAVLISVLLGVELAGLLGALFAIPFAGILQVIGRDLFDHRTGALKGEPTIGEDEIPISEVSEPNGE